MAGAVDLSQVAKCVGQTLWLSNRWSGTLTACFRLFDTCTCRSSPLKRYDATSPRRPQMTMTKAVEATRFCEHEEKMTCLSRRREARLSTTGTNGDFVPGHLNPKMRMKS